LSLSLVACGLSQPPFPVAPRTSSEPLPSTKASAQSRVINVDKPKAVNPVPPSSADPNEPLANNQIRVVLVKGTISRKLLENTRKLLGSAPVTDPGDEPIPGKLIVLLDSRGGDGMAAMEIGKMLRRNNAHVFVTGECASACVFLLAGGVVRGAPGFSVGIHQGRITMSSDTGTIKREVDVKEDPRARALLAQYERDAKIYFAQMGIPSSFFQAMQNHSTKGVYRLTGEEITFYGLSGFDDEYFEKRVRFYAQKKGKWALDKDELHRRTAKVASECAPYEQKQAEFVNCYKRVLTDRY
jgi:ATP-dependent protease ClpP protease subunit